jgi:hypothetical protein
MTPQACLAARLVGAEFIFQVVRNGFIDDDVGFDACARP